MSNSKILDDIFNNLRSYLDEMDAIREQLLPIQRQAVRMCSEIIKNVHRNNLENISENIEKTRELLMKMKNFISNAPSTFSKDYLHIVKQEFGEAVIFYNLICNNRFPTPEECNISLLDYSYALSDVVGELRRYVLNCIRKEDSEKADTSLNLMDEIYNYLFTLDYPNGLIPGLRKKVDAARNILSKTEGDVSVSINILKLKSSLDNKIDG